MTLSDQLHQALINHFLSTAVVKDPEKGYLVLRDFNLDLQPTLIARAAEWWAEQLADVPHDAMVGLPDAGSRLVLPLAMQLKTPRVLPAKRTQTVPGSWQNVVSYANQSFTMAQQAVPSHIGFVQPGQRIILVDDVVAYGDTALTAIKAIGEAGAEVVGLAVLFAKEWQGGVERITAQTGVPVHSVITVKSISNGEIQV